MATIDEDLSMDLDLAAGFVTMLAIGVFAGVLVDPVAGPSRLRREVDSAARTRVTNVLIGIAGPFIGFHLAACLDSPSRRSSPGRRLARSWCWRMAP